jgi:hypothetical protein
MFSKDLMARFAYAHSSSMSLGAMLGEMRFGEAVSGGAVRWSRTTLTG